MPFLRFERRGRQFLDLSVGEENLEEKNDTMVSNKIQKNDIVPRLLVMYFKKVSCQNLKGTCRYEHARYTLLSTPVFKQVFSVRGYQRTHVQLKTLHRSYMAQAV